MVSHNNVLPNQHFRKDWQIHVRTWFDQPGKKKSRRTARLAKAKKCAPRPVDLLRPAVRCPTVKYNTKLRMGRGFTLEEIKAAGIRRKEALTIGIPVDHRRKNRSVEGLEANIARLKEYKSKLIIFPRKMKKVKKGDSEPKVCASAKQFKGVLLPIKAVGQGETTRVLKETPAVKAYSTLRMAQSDAKLVGIRAMRKKQKEEEEKAKTK